ncbi:hypothetical protein [Paenibacillus prosopidis]|uniref:DUF4386 domain-containing protein n=1 Tax=Paenibacillus prosopidis TaxID=630520 RepID=A0A368WAF1_9BACL|nr:hypothetical protein [Paenibacillus prosopidis]RCW50053.1 hypothetical protein DFP97_10369 [Paenibacillus prosopidis]
MITVPQKFFRFSGWAMLLAGIVITIIQFVHLEDVPHDMEEMKYFVDVAVWTHVALLLAVTVLLMGFAGLFLRHASKLKWWGWIGYGLFFSVFVFDLMHAALQIFDYPVFFKDITTEAQMKEASDLVMSIQMSNGPGQYIFMAMMPMAMLGTILMCIGFLRAKIISKWPSIGYLVLTVLMFVPVESVMMFIYPIQFLVWAWFGAILAFEKHPKAEVSSNPPITA